MDDQNRLLVANADMSDPRVLFTAPGHIYWIDFLPDDERLRFTVYSGSPEIWDVSIDGSDAHPIFPEWQNIAHCCGSWVDDGKYYVFQATHNDRTQLWAINEAGDSQVEPVQITTGSCRFTFSHRLGQEQSFAKIKSMLERRHSGAPIGRGLLCRAGQSRRESGFP